MQGGHVDVSPFSPHTSLPPLQSVYIYPSDSSKFRSDSRSGPHRGGAEVQQRGSGDRRTEGIQHQHGHIYARQAGEDPETPLDELEVIGDS